MSDTVLPSVSNLSVSKLLSTPVTPGMSNTANSERPQTARSTNNHVALSAVVTPSAATPLVSGTALDARRPSPVVLTLSRKSNQQQHTTVINPADFLSRTPAASAARSTLRRLREINE